jgi:methylmalonyl-CoA/ethylmalonyl-CoA epimerase
MMKNSGGTVIELVAPLGNETPVSNFLSKNGPAPYHCCFATPKNDMRATLESLKKSGFTEIIKPAPAVALGGNDVVFLYSKEVGLVELVLRDNRE